MNGIELEALNFSHTGGEQEARHLSHLRELVPRLTLQDASAAYGT